MKASLLLNVFAVLMVKKVSAKKIGVCIYINKNNKEVIEKYDPMTHICKKDTLRLRRPNTGPGQHATKTVPIRHETNTVPIRHETTQDRTRYETTQSPIRDTSTRRVPSMYCLKEYTPETQTCCTLMDTFQSEIHEGAHSSHVCCGLKAFRRGSKDLPCNHPSMNDPLFKPAHLKRYGKTETFCSDGRLRFFLEFNQKHRSYNSPHYNATLTLLDSSHGASKQVKVAIDKFSPRKSLDGKTLLIISEHNYSQDQTFYLRSSDGAYTGLCNARALLERLTREKRSKCKNRKTS